MHILDGTALEAGRLLRARRIGCEELTRMALERIRDTESLHACVSVWEDESIERARAVQARLDAGEALSPLAGVPLAIKDNLCTRGQRTTCASRMLEGYVPPYTATSVQRLLDAGAIPVAKTNLDEFAMGGSTETSSFAPTRNPWDPARVPGGSSGGSAAAVAAGQALFALGSDTGGSIRQPSAFCGVTGLKPTYGAVSRYGLVAYASSLDAVGPIGRDIDDCAAALSIMQGIDERDATSRDAPSPFPAEIGAAGMTIGVVRESFGDGLDAGVAARVLEAAQELERLGARLVDVSLPALRYAVPAYYVIACAEASSNLARYDGIKYGLSVDAASLEDAYVRARGAGFGIEAKRRILIGSFVLSAGHFDAYYKKAMQARARVRREMGEALSSCDLLLSPVAPTVAYPIGDRIDDPLAMYLGDVHTVAVNLAGLPAASLPCGFHEGLPVGVQLIGRHFGESDIVRAARAYQAHTDHHRRLPNMARGAIA